MGDEAPGGEAVRPIRVLLIEDHRLVRAALRLLLEREPDLAVCGEAADGEAGLRLLAYLAREGRVDVVVIDSGLAGLDGLEVARRAKALAPALPVVLLTRHDGDGDLRAMEAIGAASYVRKQDIGRDLCAAIRAVVRSDPAR